MAINRYLPHLLVLPEDDATRNLAVGFSDRVLGQMQVENPAGGWPNVLAAMEKTYVTKLRTFDACHLVLLIDFDNEFPSRFQVFQQAMPTDVASRVYVLGALDEAESVKKETGKKLGPIGRTLADECEQGQAGLWQHRQIIHNQPEVVRLQQAARGFLFRSAG